MRIKEKIIDLNGNQKYILETDKSALIEAAVFKHHNMEHFCVPSQVGCPLGCHHCATTYAQDPFLGQLSDIELIELINVLHSNSNSQLTKVLSFAGHGEPMLNWENIKKTICKVSDAFSAIHMTSVGIIPVMERILKDSYNFKIFFSVHGSCDDERKQIIQYYNSEIANIRQIIDFCREYSANGGKCVWNYMLHTGNSSEDSKNRLLSLCQDIDFPLEIRFTKYIDIDVDNGIKEIDSHTIEMFVRKVSLEVPKSIRPRLSKLEGISTQIACGQLRAMRVNRAKGN